MNEKKERKHYVLGFERKRSGAFEHAFGVAQNLIKRGFDVEYYSNWWNQGIKKINIHDESSLDISTNYFNEKEGIFHLQTHTWEYNNYLEKIRKNKNLIIYNLHAVIPYYYLSEKQKTEFLNGNLEYDDILRAVNKMNDKELAQLSAIKKADHLLTISKSHKKALELLSTDKPIHVFENITDFDDLNEGFLEESKLYGKLYRESMDAENVLLYCGALYKKKGSIGIFDSFREIKSQNKKSKLILLGPQESEKESFFNSGLKKEDLESVILIPWINKKTETGKKEFLKYYYAADVLIQPMITDELYSKTVIDAMYLGIPTITCKSPYSIGTSKTAREICDSFAFLKENPEKVKEILTLAQEKTTKENTWNSYINRLNNLISDT